jgi:hypothetical protein
VPSAFCARICWLSSQDTSGHGGRGLGIPPSTQKKRTMSTGQFAVLAGRVARSVKSAAHSLASNPTTGPM